MVVVLMCHYFKDKYLQCIYEVHEHVLFSNFFQSDCEVEHEIMFSVCEKCKLNVKEQVCCDFLKDLHPFHCW